jgi:site-specific DNA-cytosine methylase
MINSSLVSAQNRKRLYWTNIPNITQPQDKCLILKDILEDLPLTSNIKNPERLIERSTYFQFDVSGKRHNSQQNRIRKLDKPSSSLSASSASIPQISCLTERRTELYYRKLTPTECERLQTVPNGYTEGVSKTQRYKMLGNGWTVEVIKHILKEVK